MAYESASLDKILYHEVMCSVMVILRICSSLCWAHKVLKSRSESTHYFISNNPLSVLRSNCLTATCVAQNNCLSHIYTCTPWAPDSRNPDLWTKVWSYDITLRRFNSLQHVLHKIISDAVMIHVYTVLHLEPLIPGALIFGLMTSPRDSSMDCNMRHSKLSQMLCESYIQFCTLNPRFPNPWSLVLWYHPESV